MKKKITKKEVSTNDISIDRDKKDRIRILIEGNKLSIEVNPKEKK